MFSIPNLEKFSSSLSTMDISYYYFFEVAPPICNFEETEFFELTQIIFSFYRALSQIFCDDVHALELGYPVMTHTASECLGSLYWNGAGNFTFYF